MPTYLIYAFIAIVILWISAIVGKGDRYQDFSLGTILLLFFISLPFLVLLESSIRPLTWDSRLEFADRILRLDAFPLARLYWRTPWLAAILGVVYNALPIAFSIAWLVDRSKMMLRAVAIAGFSAFPLYILVPACGPIHAFAGYPGHPIVPPGLLAVGAGFPRNCFPSLHFAWALLFALNARQGAWRVAFFVYALLVGVSTVAVGEHYTIDLIAAVPFTLAVRWFVSSRAKRSARDPQTAGAHSN
jgi:hypothetical protein